MIYLDHNATTAVRPSVRAELADHLCESPGNPSSTHAAGRRARAAVEEARRRVASAIGAEPGEIVFTSGGTESNNLALFGTVGLDGGGHLVVSPIEHSSVVVAARELERRGAQLTWLPLDRFGRVAADDVVRSLRPETRLVSLGWANNEIGTIQDIVEIARVCRRHGVPLHTDAVQAFGKIPVDARAVELCSLSAHKIGGVGGVGALFVRSGRRLEPLLFGGRQERGVRAGSENVLGVVGFGAAAATLDECRPRGPELREHLWEGISRLGGACRNSPVENCLENTLNVSLAGVRGEALVAALDLEGIAVSVGSACSIGAAEPSHVLRALGRSEAEARDGVRFSLGPQTTRGEIDATIAVLGGVVSRIRDIGAPRLAATA